MAGDSKTTDTSSDAVAASSALRRKLLKAGGAAVPLMVSLQSGTAWAISSCADNIARPDSGDIGDIFNIISGSSSSTTQSNISFVSSTTGIPPGSGGSSSGGGDDDDDVGCGDDDDVESGTVTGIICDCDGVNPVGNYPAANDSVEACEVTHLLVTNGSCWVSYCNGPLSGSVSINNDISPGVCNGSS